MKKPEFELFHFASIDFRDLPKELYLFIKEQGSMTYSDTSESLREHLYDIQETVELIEASEIECSDEITEQLNELLKWLDELQCSYLRITYL
jgi:hypothetical protein